MGVSVPERKGLIVAYIHKDGRGEVDGTAHNRPQGLGWIEVSNNDAELLAFNAGTKDRMRNLLRRSFADKPLEDFLISEGIISSRPDRG